MTSPPSPPGWRSRLRPFLLPGALLVGTLGLLHLGFVSLVDKAERTATAEQLARIEIAGRTVEESLQRTLEGLESYFELMQDLAQLRVTENALAPAIERRLVTLTHSQRFAVFQAALIDPDGINRWSSLGGAVHVNLRDREHFRVHLQPGQGLFVSAPLLGRVSERWSIQFSRRLSMPDGTFIGVAVLSVDPELLSNQLNLLGGLLPGQVTALFRWDGALLATSENLQEQLSRRFMATRPPGLTNNFTGIITSSLSGGRRFASIRALPGAPLYASLTIAVEEAMAPFQAQRRIYLLAELGLALIGFSLMLTLGLQRARRQERLATASAEAGRAALARVLDGVQGAVFLQRINIDGPAPPSYVNTSTMRVLRIPPDRFNPEERILQRAEPALSRAERERHYAQLRHQGFLSHDLKLRCGDGTLRWMRLAITVVARDAQGMEIVGMLTDIEDELAARDVVARAAEQRRAELARVLDGVQGAVFLKRLYPDGSQTRHYMSVGAKGLLRVGPDSAYQDDNVLGHVVPPLTLADRLSAYAEVDENGRYSRDYQLRCADGSLTWIRAAVTLISRQDDALEVVGLLTDIDDEKSAAAAAVSAARMATVGELAAGLAHEMNQPLAVIRLTAENLEMRLEAEAPGVFPHAAEGLARITQMTQRARDITDHLRMFTNSDDTPPGSIEVADALRGALVLCGQALRDAEVKLDSTLPANLPPVLGKTVLLEHVLLNLLMNARDAMAEQPAAGRSIRLVAEVTPQDVRLRVTDSGPGIPAEVMPRMFQPFFTTKPTGKGTGLGLCIAKGILGAWGGTIIAGNAPAGSTPGGARFTITLRRADVPGEAIA